MTCKLRMNMICRKPVFENAYGVQTLAYRLTSLTPGRWVYDEVVSCWAAILNHEEREITNGAPKRLYLHARTIVSYIYIF
jgi:hypothetical protein